MKIPFSLLDLIYEPSGVFSWDTKSTLLIGAVVLVAVLITVIILIARNKK